MTHRLNVVYVLLRFPFLTETFVAEEIRAVQSQGIDVQIISLLGPGPGPVHPVSKQLTKDVWYAPNLWSWQLWRAQIYYLFKKPRRYFALLSQLFHQAYPAKAFRFFLKRLVVFPIAVAAAYKLKNMPTNVIHAHFAWLSGAAARIISELLNLPFTVTVHAYDIYSIENDLLCFTTSAAAHIIAISEFNRQEVLKRCPTVEERIISVIHCGIDLNVFHPLTRVDKKPLSILSVGSLVAKKGHKYLIQACQLLKAKDIDFRCTIIGGGSGKEDLQQLIDEYGLEDVVTLRGACQQSEVLQAAQEHDLFVLACVVLPSGGRDGIPVALMEAMAMQLPAISTPVSGIPELVRHEETGWLVLEHDAAAIAEAIILLAENQPLREQLGRNGRALVENEFEIQGNAAQLIDIFRQLVQSEKKRLL